MKNFFLKILTIIFSFTLILGIFSACGEPEHVHEFNMQIISSKYLASEATCEEKAKYYYACTCWECGTETFENGEPLGHNYGEFVSNGNNTHTKTCSNDSSHTITEDCYGGTATVNNRPICEGCNSEYSELHVHEYSDWVSNNNGTHTKVCINNCNDKITENCSGGKSTCVTKATCEVCNTKYGTFSNHTIDTEWSTTNLKHWKKCNVAGCGYVSEEAKHSYSADHKCIICQYETKELVGTEINSDVFEIDNTNLFVSVPNNQILFYFEDSIILANGAIGEFYTDIECNEKDKLKSDVAGLNEGDNVFYLLVSNANVDSKVYTLTIHKNYIFTVGFETGEGSAVDEQKVEEGSFAVVPENPTRIGYTFEGWDYNFETPITDDTNINAIWVANNDTPYKVEYYLENLENEEYTILESATENLTGTSDSNVYAEIKAFEHFTAEESTVSGSIYPDGSLVLKVYYQRSEYTVKFNDNGGMLISGEESQTVKYGGSVIAPIYDRTGYTFIGFDVTDFTNISSNLTINAKWKINQYTITIKFNNGDADKVITQDYNTQIESVDNPSKTGYTLRGWDKEIPTVMPAENLTINAKWQINQYTITIKFNNGDADKVITQDYNTPIENIDNPSKTGYIFSGWDKEIPSVMPAENLTINAKWKINQYTITIKFNNGDADKVITQDYNTPIENIDNPSKTGYIFSGWDKEIPSVMPAQNLIINARMYAIFTINNGTITGLTYQGKRLANIEMPSSIDGQKITSIGDYAFRDCTSLKSIVIPNSVTSIGYRAFYNCDSLEYNISDGLKYLGNSENQYLYLAGVVNTTIPTATINNDCKLIGADAFYACTSLTSVTIGNNVTSIGGEAFSACYSLTSIVIPNSVTSIGDRAFVCCESLTSVTIGNSVTSIGLGVFSDCGSLTSIVIPNSVTSIGDEAFSGCYSLTSVVIPNSVTSIGDNAFSNCGSLTSVVIPNSVTSIGSCAFFYCSFLTSIEIPNSVTSIGDDAFSYCTSLKSIVIPNSVTSIGDRAFSYCYSLTIYCKAESKPIGWSSNWNSSNRPVVWGYEGV